MSLESELLDTIDSITGTGKFTTSGKQAFFFPDIIVQDEMLAFPLPPSQIQYLISIAEPAPYGKGEETILDTTVRKSWQIDASKIKFPTKGKWLTYLKKISQSISTDLGISTPFIADPYKLLIYEQGGHFLPHTDTEKIPRMFGTLIVALPSKHSGGELIIRHAGEEKRISFDSKDNLHTFQHTALFSDCEHEVKPVTSGYRVCLVYNLALKNNSTTPLNQSHMGFVPSLSEKLNKLKTSFIKSKLPLRAILLEHKYTEENFCLSTLKNADHTKAKALFEAAKNSGYNAYLGLITLYQMGELQGDYYSDRYYGYDDDDSSEGTMGEVYEDYQNINHWHNANDQPVQLGSFAIENAALLPETNLSDSEPDEKEAEGYTGNAGCTMEHWYRRAAIILWPKENFNRVLCHYDLNQSAKILSDYSSHHLTHAAAHSLADALLTSLAEKIKIKQNYYPPVEGILHGILALQSPTHLTQALDTFIPEQLAKITPSTWEKIHHTFGTKAFTLQLSKLDNQTLTNNPTLLLNSLTAILSKSTDPAVISPLADKLSLLDFTLGQTFHREKHLIRIDTDILLVLLQASAYITTKAQRDKLNVIILQDLSLSYIRQHLGPALDLRNTHQPLHYQQKHSLQPSALKQVINILQEETNLSLEPYPDWSRPYTPPRYDQWEKEHFDKLEAFCKNPELSTLDIAAAQNTRDTLSNHITNQQLDFDMKTIKKSRPYTLRLTKNSNSYKRALKTRAEDKELLQKLTD